MFRAMSLLIVMAFAAGPTVKVVCDLTCVTDGIPDHASCHEAAHDDLRPALKALPEACDRVAAPAPFLSRATYKVLPAAVSPVGPVAAIATAHEHARARSASANTGQRLTRAITVLRI
jgi:hypothetical protein